LAMRQNTEAVNTMMIHNRMLRESPEVSERYYPKLSTRRDTVPTIENDAERTKPGEIYQCQIPLLPSQIPGLGNGEEIYGYHRIKLSEYRILIRSRKLEKKRGNKGGRKEETTTKLETKK
jgi:hypothetical protein